MAPVGAIEELSIRCDLHVRGVGHLVVSGGQRPDGLLLGESARRRIVVEHGHRIVHLVDHIGVRRAGMEGEVTRSRARQGPGKRLVIVRQCRGLRVQSVVHYLVKSEIGGVGVAVVRADDEAVRVGFLLPGRIYTGALVLEERRRLSERTVRLDRQGGDAAAVVVGDHQRLPGRVYVHITRSLSAG